MPSEDSDIIVSRDWLLSHLDDEEIAISDVRSRGQYGAGHIPTATHIPYGTFVSFSPGIPYLDAAPREDIEKLLTSCGIGGRRVVIYGDEGGAVASRFFWTLELYGADVRILNMDFSEWARRGLPVSREIPKRAESRFVPKKDSKDYRVSLEYLSSRLMNPSTVIFDARSTQEYLGLSSHGPIAGRIPGSVNLPWNECVGEEGTLFKSEHDLLRIFSEKKIDDGKEVICYCHVGDRASHTLLALRLSGHANARIYDRSFAEWSTRADLRIEEG